MKVLVDVFSVLTIEKCLLEKLPDIFCPQVVFGLEDSVLESIAAETEESKMERASSTKKLAVLEATLKILQRLDRHKPRSESLNLPPKQDLTLMITQTCQWLLLLIRMAGLHQTTARMERCLTASEEMSVSRPGTFTVEMVASLGQEDWS